MNELEAYRQLKEKHAKELAEKKVAAESAAAKHIAELKEQLKAAIAIYEEVSGKTITGEQVGGTRIRLTETQKQELKGEVSKVIENAGDDGIKSGDIKAKVINCPSEGAFSSALKSLLDEETISRSGERSKAVYFFGKATKPKVKKKA